jgi:uncharacterized Tic20 family protein
VSDPSPTDPFANPTATGATGGGGATPPGWYADPSGTTRWWDGTQWGQVAAPSNVPAAVPYGVPAPAGVAEERGMATLVHVLGIFTGFLGPLVVYLVARADQPFTKHHAAEELNFQITLFIAYVVSFVLMLVLIGFVTFLVTWIGSIVLMIMASLAANRGEWYRYPVNIRLVSGAVGG